MDFGKQIIELMNDANNKASDLETALHLVESFNATISEGVVDKSLLKQVEKMGFNTILKQDICKCYNEGFSKESVEGLQMSTLAGIVDIIGRIWEFIQNLIKRLIDIWETLTKKTEKRVKLIKDTIDRINREDGKLGKGDKNPTIDDVNIQLAYIQHRVPTQSDIGNLIRAVIQGLNLKNGLTDKDIKDELDKEKDPFKTMVDNLADIKVTMKEDLNVKKADDSNKKYNNLRDSGYSYASIRQILDEVKKLETGSKTGKDKITEVKKLCDAEQKIVMANPALGKTRTENAKNWVNAYVKYFAAFGIEYDNCIGTLEILAAGLEIAIQKAYAEKNPKSSK